jgi:predicted PurR-regulated permease PerM
MNEQLFYWLSFCIIFLFGILLGGFIAAKFEIFVKFSKKEDYEAKVKELDRMMEEWKKKINEDDETMADKIKPFELFPEDIKRDFGLPRELK